MQRSTDNQGRSSSEIKLPLGWAAWYAWLVPLAILPSAIWRVSLLLVPGRLGRNLFGGGWSVRHGCR